ncbi:MAG: potassium channel family protein [Acidimicrobiales bacterium]
MKNVASESSTEAIDDADPRGSELGNARLNSWVRRTAVPLDIFALCTIWLTVVPFGLLHKAAGEPYYWYVGRLVVSGVYAADLLVRLSMSTRRWYYFTHHPVSVLSVFLPVVRLLFSLRLLRGMFKKGNTLHFLIVAVVLLLNLMVIVWGFEREAPGGNITSLGIALWWGCVTVFTVGYGDYYPITNGGRIAAVAIMAVGLTTAAVITAQIASSFMDQAQFRRDSQMNASSREEAIPVPAGVTTDERLTSIELLLRRHFDDKGTAADQT